MRRAPRSRRRREERAARREGAAREGAQARRPNRTLCSFDAKNAKNAKNTKVIPPRTRRTRTTMHPARARRSEDKEPRESAVVIRGGQYTLFGPAAGALPKAAWERRVPVLRRRHVRRRRRAAVRALRRRVPRAVPVAAAARGARGRLVLPVLRAPGARPGRDGEARTATATKKKKKKKRWNRFHAGARPPRAEGTLATGRLGRGHVRAGLDEGADEACGPVPRARLRPELRAGLVGARPGAPRGDSEGADAPPFGNGTRAAAPGRVREEANEARDALRRHIRDWPSFWKHGSDPRRRLASPRARAPPPSGGGRGRTARRRGEEGGEGKEGEKGPGREAGSTATTTTTTMTYVMTTISSMCATTTTTRWTATTRPRLREPKEPPSGPAKSHRVREAGAEAARACLATVDEREGRARWRGAVARARA